MAKFTVEGLKKSHIIQGDCLEVMSDMDSCSVDSIVTDPPYGISFKGKNWDHGVPGEAFWKEAIRIAKPGAHLLAFGGTRKFHRLTCAIEDAGWEIRDCVMWVYGSGFPKSTNVSLAIDKRLGVSSIVVGVHRQVKDLAYVDRDSNAFHGDNSFSQHWELKQASSELGKMWSGWGTSLKPAWEPVIVGRKCIEGTVADNVMRYGTGPLNIDGCRIDREDGDSSKLRWPANVIHDGSEDVLLSLGGAERFFYCAKASKADRGADNTHPTVKPTDLMRYLCRLVTPPNGIVLDPFCGSGSTGKAALLEGFRFIGIEKEREYAEIAARRASVPSSEIAFDE